MLPVITIHAISPSRMKTLRMFTMRPCPCNSHGPHPPRRSWRPVRYKTYQFLKRGCQALCWEVKLRTPTLRLNPPVLKAQAGALYGGGRKCRVVLPASRLSQREVLKSQRLRVQRATASPSVVSLDLLVSGSLGRRALTLMYGFDPVSLGLGYECISHQTAPPSQLKSCQSWLQRQPRPLAADRTEGLAANRQPVDA